MALSLILLAGCGGSDPSGPGADRDFVYSPDRSQVEITILNSQFFKVSTEPAGDVAGEWYVDGAKKMDGAGFNYFPAAVGWDTVRVEASADGSQDTHEWYVHVVQTVNSLPTEVQGIVIEHAPTPGEATIRWLRVAESTHPLVDYLVAVSYDGPVSMLNWDSATLLEAVPHVEGVLQYSRTYDLEDGRQAWFAVRARDSLGQLSEITRVYDHLVSYAWTLGVQVDAVGGGPVSEVILRWVVNGEVRHGNTPYDGFVEIGPFRSIDTVQLQTQITNGDVVGAYYDYVNDGLTVDDAPLLEIKLIPRREIDSECWTLYADHAFLNYLRTRTRTDLASAIRPNHKLLHWAHYPLQVYVPEFSRTDGTDMRALTLIAMENWNTIMGEPYFEVAADASGADVLFEYTDPTGAYGEVSLLEPTGFGDYLEATIPELMSVAIAGTLLTEPDFVVLTNMHELGHVLGLYEHTDCTHSPYLMNRNPSSSLDDEYGGVHPDEQLAVRMVRYLPNGTEMDRYVLD